MSFEMFKYSIQSIIPDFLIFSEEDIKLALESPLEFISLEKNPIDDINHLRIYAETVFSSMLISSMSNDTMKVAEGKINFCFEYI